MSGDTLAENIDDYFYDVEDEVPAPDATPFQWTDPVGGRTRGAPRR
jgi:hypothetical protein